MEQYIKEAAEIIKKGGVILYPTDTVLGLGCDATNSVAIQKIIDLKKRPNDKSFIVLVEDDARLNKYVQDVPSIAWDLMDIAEKPTTIVFDKGIRLAPEVIGSDGSVAVRIVKNDFCIQLIKKTNLPIVSTSVNISGNNIPLHFNEIPKEILDKVDYIVPLCYNQSQQNEPSSIIKITANGEITVLRK
jgi:L-threonylcarbamoyladenylate synthase